MDDFQGPLDFHGHGSWYVCKVTLSHETKSSHPKDAILHLNLGTWICPKDPPLEMCCLKEKNSKCLGVVVQPKLVVFIPNGGRWRFDYVSR